MKVKSFKKDLNALIKNHDELKAGIDNYEAGYITLFNILEEIYKAAHNDFLENLGGDNK